MIVCQFGWTFFADKGRAVREARRVLKRNGLFLFSVWDRTATNPEQDALRCMLYEYSPRLTRFHDVAFGFHDRDEIRSLVGRHDFFDVSIDTVALEMLAPSASDAARAMRRRSARAGAH